MNNLLICAKAVGIDAYIVPAVANGREWVAYNEELYTKPNRTGIYKREYNPRTNDVQNRELELKLLYAGWTLQISGPNFELFHPIFNRVYDPVLNEAIIKAVVAMEDTHE